MKQLKIIVVMFGVSIGLLAGIGSTMAQGQQAKEYTGLDILFIVDQSGSMGGTSEVDASDPFNLRFEAPWYAMYWLGEDRLLVHDNVDYRIAMIQFGSNAEAWIFNPNSSTPHWKSIAPNSRNEWQPIYSELSDELRNEMRTEYDVTRSAGLGYTNFTGAFQLADTIFSELPEPVGERRRVIIVLTDGDPALSDDYSDDEKRTHMATVQSIVAEQFAEPDYRSYVIGMVSDVNYWDLTGPYWEEMTNDPCTEFNCPDDELDRASLVGNFSDVSKRFQAILQDLTATLPKPTGVDFVDAAVIPGPLNVPPYLESITFTYFKSDPAERLILSDPQGDIDLSRANVEIEGAAGPIEAVRVVNPLPGQWFVATDPPGTDVDITMRQIFAQSILYEPTNRSQVQYLPVPIEYGLLTEAGQPLPSYSDQQFRLQVEATVTADDQSWPVMLTHQGQNVYSAEFTPSSTGPHTIFVHAETQRPDGSPLIVFDEEIGSFDVSPAVLVPLNVPSGTIRQGESAAFSFELQDSRGFPITEATPLDVTIAVTGESASPIQLAQQSDGSIYSGSFPIEQAGPHTADVFATISTADGDYTVADEEVAQFDVTPVLQINLSRTEPISDTLTQTETELWPSQRIPYAVTVELRDENDQLIDPNIIFDNPSNAVKLVVTDENGDDVSDLFDLQPTSTRGVYRAVSDQLGLGTFDFVVTTQGNLDEDYRFGSATEVRASVTRTRHPQHIPILVGVLGLLLFLILLSAILILRYRNKTRHPCRGRLVIIDSEGMTQWQTSLDTFKRNHVVIKSKDINPITHVAKLVVHCKSQEQFDKKEVEVEVYLDNSKAPIRQTLRPSDESRPATEVKLGQYRFWLMKDPNMDQTMRERGGKGTDEEWNSPDWGSEGKSKEQPRDAATPTDWDWD